MTYQNNAMKLILASHKAVTVSELALPLKNIMDGGFTFIDGMCFFKHVAGNVSKDGDMALVKSRFGDCSGFENSINRIHVDFYIEKEIIPQALALFDYMPHLWRGLNMPPAALVLGINISPEFGEQAHLSFYLSRVGEEVVDWQNIDSCQSAIMLRLV